MNHPAPPTMGHPAAAEAAAHVDTSRASTWR